MSITPARGGRRSARGALIRKVLRRGAVAGLVVAAGLQFVRPPRTNPASDPAASLTAAGRVPQHVSAVLDRACRDCHSNETRWPWYSQVAPISWWVIDHVNHARSHFNYSEWSRYDGAEQQKLLKSTCDSPAAARCPSRPTSACTPAPA